MEYLVFYKMWFLLAEGRDTDAKRLAFYDAIMRYAFQGVEPDMPVRGESPGEAWAAWDAFVVARQRIDIHNARAKAGRAGKGISRNKGNSNASKHGGANTESIQNQSEDNSKSIQNQNGGQICIDFELGEKIKDKREKIKDKKDTMPGACSPSSPPLASKRCVEAWFAEFWKAYPSTCPRKVDKKKCAERFAYIMKAAKDPAAQFRAIMEGIEAWKRSDLWTRDGGQYIRAPLVWLNSESWNDRPASAAGTDAGEQEGDERYQAALAKGMAVVRYLDAKRKAMEGDGKDGKGDGK